MTATQGRRLRMPHGEESVGRICAAMAGELPLDGMGERFLASAVSWTATAPEGATWDLRWFRDGLILIAAAGEPCRVGFRAKARTIQQARLHAVRIANLIADGITREDDMGTPWSQMDAAQNIAARMRLAAGAGARARTEGNGAGARVQDQVLARIRTQAALIDGTGDEADPIDGEGSELD